MTWSGKQRLSATGTSPAEQSAFDRYDMSPAFPLTSGRINVGYRQLADELRRAVETGARVFALEGFAGVPWNDVRQTLDAACRAQGLTLTWRNVDDWLLVEAYLNKRLAPYLGGDDPLFGRLFDGELSDFFGQDRLQHARESVLRIDGPVVVYGSGAALACVPDRLIYLDVPKDVLQIWMRQGQATNLATTETAPFGQMYKRAYFVDWPALNRHKATLLPDIDLYVDLQDPALPAFMSGDDLRAALDNVATHPFRVRPWFFPGPWGGQWMKQTFAGLDPDAPNYAWSFELIVPENGLVFERGDRLECSFDLLMFQAHERVLGRAADRFGYNFPIRFDYLDTIDGGNLSIQCHPRTEYIRNEFGEPFTQDESYYIVRAEPGARVYIGFRNYADSDEFRAEVEASGEDGTPVDIDRFVHSEPAHDHDLFFIPNGTIHASGRGNLVLEISATPYIYTFKIYDWVRTDLEGKPRPLNIARAWDNLHFDRRESYVRDHLRAHPRQIADGPGWRELDLGTHEEIFYAVHRYELDGSVDITTDARCHVLNVVEGQGVIMETGDGFQQRFDPAETFVIPASVGEYHLTAADGQPCKIVKAFVK